MVKLQSPRTRSSIEQAIGKILWDGIAGDVYRCKGIFRDPFGTSFMLQGVGEVFEVTEEGRREEQPDEGRFLFVGTSLDKGVMEELLRASDS